MTIPIAYTADHVARLTGLTPRQLGYWARTDFFKPHLIEIAGRRPYGRVYSFRDVVGLRTIALLRDRIPLQELRRIGSWLTAHYDTPWASLRFYVGGRRVFFDDPVSGARLTAREGRRVMPFEMEAIAGAVEREAIRLTERSPEDLGRVVRHRYVQHNAPAIAGTRIPTAAIWRFHEDGHSADEIVSEYPRLRPVDVAAAIEYERRRRPKRAS